MPSSFVVTEVDHEFVDLVKERLDGIHRRIERAGGNLDAIRVVAVTKTFGPQACAAALMCGLSELGENYATELIEKASLVDAYGLAVAPTWHFLGALQRNKIARLCSVAHVFEGVDRLSEGEAIARHAPGSRILVEVATDERETKGGVVPEEVTELVCGLQQLDLRVEGLMTVAPAGDLEGARQAFRKVRTLVDQLGLDVASMGMTEDLEVAVEEGATTLRLGRALFGQRAAR